LIVAASHVHVRVLNGTGEKGAAGRAADDLRAAGFDVVGVGDADSNEYAQTIVRYGPERVESSQTLAAAVPGATRLADDGLGRIVQLIVGTNYTGAHTVTLSGGTPAPSTSPGVVKGISADEDVCVAANGPGGGNSA
jgi:hypothetical protein